MNDSECTCDIRLGGCTCGAMERERERGATAGDMIPCPATGCEYFLRRPVAGETEFCRCGQRVFSPNVLAQILNAAAVNANVSPDVVRERDLLLHTPPEPVCLFTKQQAAEMHAELVARIEALEAHHVSRITIVNETARSLDFTTHVAGGGLTITVRDADLLPR